MNINEKIHQLVRDNKEYCFELLSEMVAYDSRMLENGKYGREKGIQDYMKKRFGSMGAEVDAFSPDNEKICNYPGYNKNHCYKDRENVVAVFRGRGKGRSLILNGHCDIVPPGNEKLWSSDPFECVKKTGAYMEEGQPI